MWFHVAFRNCTNIHTCAASQFVSTRSVFVQTQFKLTLANSKVEIDIFRKKKN